MNSYAIVPLFFPLSGHLIDLRAVICELPFIWGNCVPNWSKKKICQGCKLFILMNWIKFTQGMNSSSECLMMRGDALQTE